MAAFSAPWGKFLKPGEDKVDEGGPCDLIIHALAKPRR